MKFVNLMLIGLVMVVGAQASAMERFVLQMNDTVYTGKSTIHLRNLLNRTYRNVNFDRFELESVHLMAKSYFGSGSAALKVGPYTSNEKRIYGGPAQFNDPHPRSFDRIGFQNRFGVERGAWQLQVDGNVKVRTIVVMLKREHRGGWDGRDGRDGRGRGGRRGPGHGGIVPWTPAPISPWSGL